MDRIEDRLELRDLTARYAYYVDTFQTDKIMELWTEDAVFAASRFDEAYSSNPEPSLSDHS